MRTIAAALALAAMLAGVPADARDRREGPRKHHRHRDKGDEVGAFVAGAIIAGGLVALLGKKKRAEPVAVEAAQADPDAATAACVASAEGEGRRFGPIAQVEQVTLVEPDGPGFRIEGDVLLRANWREPGQRRGFTCEVDGEAVRSVTLEEVEVAALP